MAEASAPRAAVTVFFAAAPMACRALGLPKEDVMAADAAAAASGQTGVVAELSK